MDNKKIKIRLIVAIALTIVVLMGVSFAFYRYQKTGLNNQLVVGDIYMNYRGGNSKNIAMTPSDTYIEDDYFEFTIDGKNTSTKDIVYEIVLNHGDDLSSPNIRLDDNYLRFRLVELDSNNQESVLIEETGFKNLDNTKLYVGRINGENNEEVNKKYRLYTWVEGVIVGNVDEARYSSEEWENVYTNISVEVNGDFEEKSRSGSIKVTFNAVGGTTPIKEKYYDVGDKYGELPTPTKKNNGFLGWYLEDTYQTLVTSNTEISGTSNKTLYAKWQQNGATVVLNINGGTSEQTENIAIKTGTNEITPSSVTMPERSYTVTGFEISSSRKSDGAVVTNSEQLRTRSGGIQPLICSYTFDGWYTASTGGEKVINYGDNLSLVSNVEGYTDAEGKWTRNDETTLFARWIENKVVLPKIEKEGYICGWSTDTNATGINYASGSQYVAVKDTTLYGVCIENGLKINLDKNGGTYEGTIYVTAKYNSSEITPDKIVLAEKEYKLTGFKTSTSRNSDGANISDTKDIVSKATLNGYYTATTGGEKVLNANKTATFVNGNVSGYLENGKWIKKEETTLYAQYGNMPAVTLPTITKTGYRCGWTTEVDGDEIVYQTGLTNFVPSRDMTLYGVCNVLELTFNNQSINKTFSTNSQTASVTVASNGSGTYTYTEVSEKNSSNTATNYISISGTTITIAANTPVNTYSYVIKATDTVYNMEKTATYTITVGKANDTVNIEPKSTPYTGSQVAANTATATSGTAITYTYYGSTDCSGTALSGAPTDKGNYSVKAVSAGNGNYNSGNKCVAHTITAKAVTVTAGSQSRAWNNSALTNNTCTAGTNQLVSGHTVSCTMTSGSTITTAGSVANTIDTVLIKNGNIDVTGNYNVTKVAGTLTITLATPTLTLTEVNTAYTGSQISANTVSASPDAGGAKTYEYYSSTDCTGTPLSGAPTAAGNYSVKATVAAVANKTNVNSICKTHTITRAKTATTGACANPTYNGSSQTLASGGANVDYTNNSATDHKASGTYTVTVTPKSNYAWSDGTYAAKTLDCNIAQKAVTVTAGSQSRAWNNSALTNNTCTAGNDQLVTGHTVSCTMTSGSTITLAGSVANTIDTVLIKNGTTDVTGNYNVTKVAGTLTVTKATPTVTLTEKTGLTYNGSTQGGNTATVSPNAGGTISYKYYTNDTCTTGETTTVPTNAGTYYIKAYVAAVENKTEASSSACIKHVIAQKAVTVTAGSQSRAWNNNALTNNTCTAGSNQLISGHTVSCTMTSASTITTAGSVANTIDTVSIKNGTTDVTGNYNVTKVAGTLTITLATPTLTLTEVNTAYTGSQISANTVSASPDAGGAKTYEYYSSTDCTGTPLSGAPTAAGNYSVKATVAAVANKTNVNSICKTHTITRAKTATTGACANPTYNGSSQTLASGGANVDYTNNSATDHKASGTYTVTVTPKSNYAWSDGTYTAKTLDCNIAQKAVTLTAGSQSRAWNNSALTNNTCTAGSNQLVTGHTVSCTMTSASTVTLAGSVANTIDTVLIKNGNTDVTGNYNVTKVAGTLTITLATPTLSLTEKSATYTGSAIAANTVSASPDAGGAKSYEYYSSTDCTGDALSGAPTAAGNYSVKATVAAVANKTNVNSICKTHTITRAKTATTGACANPTYNGSSQTLASGGANVDYTNNSATDHKTSGTYTVTVTPKSNYAWSDGTYAAKTLDCNIAQKAVTVTAASQSRAWNNTALTNNTCTAGNNQLVTGHTVSCTMTSASTVTLAGSVANTIDTVSIKNGTTDVTGNYNVTKVAGTLTITLATPTLTLTEVNTAYTGSQISANTVTASPDAGGAKTYEYYSSTDCTGTALSGAPTAAGNYSVKATVAAVANKTNANSICKTHTITRAKTATTGACASPTYNGSSQTLASGGANVDYTNNSATDHKASGTYTVTVTPKSNYAWSDGTYAAKTLSCNIGQKAVTVTAGSQSRAWNNTALTNNTCTAGNNQLVTGHTVSCTMTSASTVTLAGSVANTIDTVLIKNGNTDVTGNYNVTKVAGTLTVTLATPTLSLTEKSTAYTGNAIAANTVSASPDAGGAKTYEYYSSTDCTGTALSGAPTNVGNYSVKATVAAVANKTNVNTICKTHTITQATATNSVAITGTNTWGSTLTATITTNSPGTKGYQWYYNNSNSTSGGTAINGATSSTYTIAKDYVGKYIYVVASVGASGNYTTPSNSSAVTSTAVAKQASCGAPSGVTIGNDGKVTWTASATASGYQISIDNTTYTDASSGVDYNSTITASTGSRTVYVRSKCDTTYYTNANSTSVNKATTVYSVTLTKGTGISTVTGAGNYITGRTVTLGATAGTGYTWNKWTQTSGGADVSTTNAYVLTISNSNIAYTANATANTYSITYTLNDGTHGTTHPETYKTSDNDITISDPTRIGYTFTGWSVTTAPTAWGSGSSTSGSKSFKIAKGTYGNIVLSANWSANSYTVTANANGGSIASTNGWTGTGNTSTKSVTFDSTYGTLPTVSRTGYTFNGWTSDNLFENADTLTGVSYIGTLDTTNKYKESNSVKTNKAWQGIYFNLKKLYDDGKISVGDKVTFSIYYKIDFTLTKSTSFTLYRAASTTKAINVTPSDAVPNEWHRLVYTITIDDTSITYTNARIETNYYETSDYYFNGNMWFAAPQIEINDSATGYTPYYLNSNTVVSKESNHIIKAQWTPNTYTVVYNNSCNGTASGTMSNSTHTYDVAKNLNDNAFGCNNVVNYNYHGATGGNSSASGTATATFLGWTVGGPNLLKNTDLSNKNLMTLNNDGTLSFNKDNSSGTGTNYANFFYNKNDNLETSTNYVYIANVKEKATSSTTNGMTIYQGNTNAQVYASPASVTVNSMVVGLNYLNTSTISDFTGTTLSLRGFVSIPAGASTSMKFRPILIKGTYNNKDLYYYNKGSVTNLATSGTVNVYTDWNEPTVTLPTPTRTGYTFNGWYTAETGGTKVGNGGATYMPSGNTTLHAHWTANELTFENQSINKTFSTNSQTASVTSASNGTGTYTYSEVSEKNSSNTATSYISISGTTITIAANTPANAYTYVIRATDSNSAKTKDATYTITVGKANDTVNIEPKSTTYTGSAIAANTATATSGTAITYTYYGSTDCSGTALSGAPTNKGNYSVKAVSAGNGNYNSGNKCVAHTITAKAVTVTAGSQSRAWNNSALTNNTCTAGNNQLVTGHTVSCTMTSGSTITTAGSVANTIDTVLIKNGNTDVTGNYNVTKANGTLTITLATPTLSLTEKSTAYTGSQISANTVTASPDAGGAKSYTYYSSTDCSGTALSGAPTAAGNYSVKATVAAVANKTNVNSICKTHTITQATATNSVAITGTNTWGSTLTATITTNSPGTKGYQWYYNNSNSTSGGTAISGATSSTYTIAKDYVGKYIYVVASVGASTNYTTPSNSSVVTDTAVAKQASCGAPSGVTIANDGKVTWTASATASGYQISIDNTNFTDASSGVDYNSTITASTGSRTVYVRSKCDTTYYTNANSTSVNKGTTVYSVTLTKGTGISTVTGAGNYITGRTVTLGATAGTGYTWNKWTQTSGGADVSTTNAYALTISNSNIAYTANATVNTYTISYTLNGGSATNPTSYTVETTTFTLNNPTKTGYTFNGWTGSNGTTPQTSVSIAKGSTGNKTYTANWTLDPITINSFAAAANPIYKPSSSYSGNKNSTTTATLSYTGTPASVTYSSSRSSVATVTKTSNTTATITAVAPGSANITVTLSYYDSNHQAETRTIPITVVDVGADNISYTPPSGACTGNENCNDVQLMIDKISGMLD